MKRLAKLCVPVFALLLAIAVISCGRLGEKPGGSADKVTQSTEGVSEESRSKKQRQAETGIAHANEYHAQLARLKAESDPYQKRDLILKLGEDDSESVIIALVEQLGDTRKAETRCAECPSEFENPSRRVCDVAYDVLGSKLAKTGLLHDSGLPRSVRDAELEVERRLPPPDRTKGVLYLVGAEGRISARDKAIAAIRQFYEANQETILRKLQGPSPSLQPK